MRWSEEQYQAWLHRGLIDASMTEAQLMTRLRLATTRLGYLWYHTHDSRRSTPGFPDVVLVHPHGDTTLYLVEGKRETEQPTLAQWHWLKALERVERVHAGVLRPSTLEAFVAGLRTA